MRASITEKGLAPKVEGIPSIQGGFSIAELLLHLKGWKSNISLVENILQLEKRL